MSGGMVASSPGAVWIDLAAWLAVLLGTTVVKGLFAVFALGIDPRHVPRGEPRVYLVEYLTPLLALPAMSALLWRRGQSWGGLGLTRPEHMGTFLVVVAGTTLATLVLNLGLRRLPLLWGGSWPPSEFEALAGNWRALLWLGPYTLLLVGLTEELMFRGFLLSRFAALFGGGQTAWYVAVVVVALVFGALHAQHGALNVLNGCAIGLLYGLVYLLTGRNLWVVVAAHSLYDTLRLSQYVLG